MRSSDFPFSILGFCILFLLGACNSNSSDTASAPPAPTASAQVKLDPDPLRFAEAMETIAQIPFSEEQERIVFTGSSSIRFWKDIGRYYPEQQIINTGFGGSEMSDLQYYLEQAVLRFSPSKVFIYEGDNDINSKRPIPLIMEQTQQVIKAIGQQYPNCQIFLISAKPSLARWHLKKEYQKLNQAFKKYAESKNNCQYIDIWQVMLNKQGEVIPSIFIEDGLHMNKAGYDLWDSVIRSYVAS